MANLLSMLKILWSEQLILPSSAWKCCFILSSSDGRGSGCCSLMIGISCCYLGGSATAGGFSTGADAATGEATFAYSGTGAVSFTGAAFSSLSGATTAGSIFFSASSFLSTTGSSPYFSESSSSPSSSRSRFFLTDHSQNSSNRIWPRPLLSIFLNSSSGFDILPTHFSISGIAALNSSKSILWSSPVSILLKAT